MLLDDKYSGAEPKLDANQMSELEGHLEEYILPDAKSVIAHIDKLYGIRYSVSGVTDLLHRLGFSYKKPTHVPGKQDPVKQQAFVRQYDRINAHKGENDPIYFADATHPQHNSIPSYGWIFRIYSHSCQFRTMIRSHHKKRAVSNYQTRSIS